MAARGRHSRWRLVISRTQRLKRGAPTIRRAQKQLRTKDMGEKGRGGKEKNRSTVDDQVLASIARLTLSGC